MSESGSKRLLAAAVVWLVILGAGAAAWKLLLAPKREREVVGRTGSAPRDSSLETIALALDSFSGYAILRSGAIEEELAAEGLALRLVDDGADYAERIRSLQRKDTQLAVFTVDALIKASETLGSLPGTIVMTIDETRGADAMVAWKQGVPNIDALDRPDARLVLTPDSPSETLARVVTAHFDLPNLPADAIEAVDGPEAVYDRFLRADRSEPRAYVMWEPHVSRALENEDAHVLIDSSRFKGYIVDVLVAERSFLLEHEDQVAGFVRAYLRALYADRERMSELVREDSRDQGERISRAQAERLVQGILWKNTTENYAHMGLLGRAEARGLQPMNEIIRNITRVLMKTGSIQSDPAGGAPHTLYYDRILAGLKAEDFHPGLLAGGEGEAIRARTALAALTEAECERLVAVGTLQVDRISFARGTARLTGFSERSLGDLAETLRVWPHYYLVIEGRAAAVGDPEANRRLAAARAQAAADYLTGEGIEAARLCVRSRVAEETGGAAQSVSFILGQLPY